MGGDLTAALLHDRKIVYLMSRRLDVTSAIGSTVSPKSALKATT
jgi:hypothetical protein